jgi:hypothetical protein
MPGGCPPFSGRKILLYGTAQVTPASKEGKSKKAKGKSEEDAVCRTAFSAR